MAIDVVFAGIPVPSSSGLDWYERSLGHPSDNWAMAVSSEG